MYYAKHTGYWDARLDEAASRIDKQSTTARLIRQNAGYNEIRDAAVCDCYDEIATIASHAQDWWGENYAES